MALDLPRAFVLFDLEYTSGPGAHARDYSGPNEHREVIQIGAIKISEMVEEGSLSLYVRPVKNPQLSEYIIELTGITQKDVDEKGLPFTEAMSKFLDFVGDHPAYCWGKDTEILEENDKYFGGTLQLSREQFHNLQTSMLPLLKKAGIDASKYSSGTLIEAFGPSTRRAHDALNDMRNLLDAVRELQKL